MNEPRTETSSPESAAGRLREVYARIAAAAREAGRDPAQIHLVAVSKTFGEDAVIPVIEAGQRIFGENRVQEAQAKWPGLRDRWPDLELHLVGPLQSNKTRDAVQLFDMIQTIDRPKIAQSVSREMSALGRAPRLLVQVNTGEEPNKAGIAPAEAVEFTRYCRHDLGLGIEGLMCIPPLDEEPAVHFAFLARLAEECGLSGLSMGMSADFETAVEFGATWVRVGSAIFGAREKG
ncbi:MAG: YggS family pyridoxal phosphate-dependent enzyme [Dichotomicrobium sp.]